MHPRPPLHPAFTGRRRRRVHAALTAAALIAVLGTAVVGMSSSASAGTADCADGAPSSIGCFPVMAMGISTPGLPKTTAAMDELESLLGRQADVGLTFTSFRYAFDAPALRALALSGAMPMITWEPFDPTAPDANPYPLTGIAAGTSDAYLRAQAARIRDVGRPVALRFGHEMNAAWYPWGAGVNGNTPADYVAAYRHIHDVFEQEDVNNVTWVWSPAALDTATAPQLSPFYPGDDYVDWAGLSVYFDQSTDTWASTVVPTVRQLDSVAPTKPVYLAETGVLPGATRPAMIHDLLGNLLRTPRAIGFTWFDIPSRQDWQIDTDPLALTAVRDELGAGWYDVAAVGLAPMLQVAPTVAGVPRVGQTLTVTSASWRGATATAGRWLLCTDATTASCRAAGTGPALTLGADALGTTVRYEVVATGAAGGTTTVISLPSATVVTVPAKPARPLVEARSGGARIVFPVAPLGTTHWRLRLDGAPVQPVPVGTTDYWLTGLTNGTSHTLSLAAVATSSVVSLESPTTAGTFTPMTQQFSPFVSVTGPTATFTLPKAPVGAEKWVLTVNGIAQHLPLSTTTATATGLSTGQPLRWSLVAAAGMWDGAPYGGLSVPSTGTFTPLATPTAPVVTSGAGSLTLTMPAAPVGATGWRVSVGATTYPDLALGTPNFTVTGLYPGYLSTWTLRVVNPTSRSLAVSGQAAAR